MKRQSLNQKNSKLIIYVLVIAFIFGICAVVVQDINIPTEHVSQRIEVTLEK